MKVSEVMTRDVVTVRAETPFKDVAGVLVDEEISAVPVVDEGGFVIGVVSEADLLAKHAYADEPKGRVHSLVDLLAGRDRRWIDKARALVASDVMTPIAVCATPDEDLHVVARRMLEHAIKRVVVVDEGRPIGIVSRSDLIRLFVETDEALQLRIEEFLRRCGFAPPDYRVSVTVRNGIVRLDGGVPYEDDIRVVGGLVGELDGVVAVTNRLLYREARPVRTASRGLV